MSTKTITLECRYLKGRYPKLGLKFSGGKATVSAEKFAEIKEKMREQNCSHLLGTDFAEVGKLSNAAKPSTVKVIRKDGLREEIMRQLEQEQAAKKEGAEASEETGAVPSDDRVDVDEAERLIREHNEVEEGLSKVKESERLAKAAARKAAKK